MKIKAKLISGVGLLFALIILLAAMSGFYITSLKNDSNNILVANYNTLEYARNMMLALEEKPFDSNSQQLFESNLKKQKNNVTENEELEVTNNIQLHFNQLKSKPNETPLTSVIRKDIAKLMELNMLAIEHKSSIAKSTADEAVLWISFTGMACFLIAFVLLVNLPGNIADPIKNLTNSIKQIANQNYKERVHFEGHNEYGELAQSFNTMAIKLEEYAESKLDKIIKGKKRIETLINNMHDPVIGLDEDKNVLFANDEALKITGLKSEEFIGKKIENAALNNDLVRDLIKDLNDANNQGKKNKNLKIFVDGKESYFEKEIIDINIIPTGESETQLIGHVIMLHNVTLFKELDIAKTNYIGTVSHEFKTPISSIKMSLALLNNHKIGQLNPEQKQLLDSINDDSDRLLKITGELLNLAQVESGNIQLTIKPTDPMGMIQYAMDAIKTQASQRNIKLQLSYHDKLPNVMADSEKTTWVLINLIANAIRYSYDNSTVYVSVEQIDRTMKFAVKDTGIGISDRYKNKIFDRYFRVPGTLKEGTGLGLAISKEFIEAQGGSIGVESDLGIGSTFFFTLHL